MKNIRILALLCLALAASWAYADASETKSQSPTALGEAAKLWESKLSIQKKVDVSLFVTFPASRLKFHHDLTLDQGTTAAGAVSTVYKTKQGLVCCDSRDLFEINGVPCRPAQEKWWTVHINGNTQNVSARTILKQGDIVEWRYDETQKSVPTEHIRLEEWVLEASQ